tara:strand:+ start:3166 stop:3663 length:498 start_codon:yes stop_codon:yes gene_type:complete
MIYDMTKPEHLAHFLNELPTKEIMQEHGRFYAKHKTSEFMAEVKRHMLAKTKIVPEVTVPGPLIARARNSDPETSHIRADYLNRTKKLNGTQSLVVRALEDLGPSNSKQIASWIKENEPDAEGEWANVSPVLRPMERDLGLLIEKDKVDNKIVWDIHHEVQGRLL